MTIYQITGRPAPLTDCRLLTNHSGPPPFLPDGSDGSSSKKRKRSSSGSGSAGVIRVTCSKGFDGGLPQNFLLEVYQGEELKSKVL